MPTERVRELCVNLKPNKDSINKATIEIANIFIETAKMTFPTQRKSYRTGNDKPWFGGKCRVARNKYHQTKKRFKRTQNYNDKDRLITASKAYKRKMNFFINKQKQKNEDKLRQIHSTNPKEFWKYLNSFQNKGNEISPTVNEFYDFFKNVNCDTNSPDFDLDDSTFKIDDDDNILNASITENEVQLATRSLKTGKSAGCDGITNEYLKNSSERFMAFYVKLFNIVFETGIFPDAWQEGRLRPIYKNKGERNKPENYRPITILSCLGKLFTSILNNRLTKFVERYDILNYNQAGFRKEFSTTDHIFTLHALIDILRSSNKKLYCAFIDFTQAFDSVWRVGLWKKLLSESTNGKFFRIMLNMYNNIKSCISVNDTQSPFFPCERGVRQGENLSPLLFALYLNDLEAFLISKNQNGVTVDITTDEVVLYLKLIALLYADDTVLFADSPANLQQTLDTFVAYCKEWKLKVNLQKN